MGVNGLFMFSNGNESIFYTIVLSCEFMLFTTANVIYELGIWVAFFFLILFYWFVTSY